MPFIITTATKKIFNLSKRIKVIQGGTSAGKTVGILEVLVDRCQRDKKGDVTSLVSESFPHLKRGAIRDFLNIMQEQNYFDERRWNRTDSSYTFETGAILEFFSADQPGKVRGPRRKRLFINEANNISFETYEQLEIRTSDEIFIDYNPVTEFWVHENLLQRDDVDFLILTYKDNEALEESIIKSIESRKDRKNWWKVYGLGELGELEGKIYNNWRIVDEIPHDAKLECYGLDFGYTNDPTACVAVYRLNGAFYLDEIIHQKGLSNKQIADMLLNQVKAPVWADSAEPKSIDEIASYGVPILPSTKGRDSVRQGINLVQDQRISVTKRSTNVIKEYRNYLWLEDRDGKILNEPQDIWNHSMDATRYAITQIPRLVPPLTPDQKEAKIFAEAMKRKKQMGRSGKDLLFINHR